jgi:hypothetical protein
MAIQLNARPNCGRRDIGDGADRIYRPLIEAAGYADNVAGQNHVEDLPLAVAQQLVADGVAVPHKAKLAKLVSIDDELSPPPDRQFAVDDRLKASQVGGIEIDVLQQPRDERVLLQYSTGCCREAHGRRG